MIPIRLPWRPRARPSATLHEIPIYSKRANLGSDRYNRPIGLSRCIFWNQYVPIAITKHAPMAIIWNLAALISSSWNLPNDELALKNELNRLESSWSSLDGWLNFWTLIVVIGVAVEVVVIVVEHRHGMHDFRRGIIRPPDKPSAWLLAFGLLGAGLVAIGVAGEFWIHIKAGRVETEMRDATGSLVAIADGKANAANERASQNEKDAAQLRTDLEKAKGETKAAEAKLEGEQQKTARAQKEAADAQLALKKYVEEVARRERPRQLDGKKFVKSLQGKPQARIVLLYDPGNSEAWHFARDIYWWLGKGVGNDKGAGWEVSVPTPIPSNAAITDPTSANAPPAMRFSGAATRFGITFVVKRMEANIPPTDPCKAASASGDCLFWVRQALIEALVASIIGERSGDFMTESDDSLPDDVIVLVVGPKPPIWLQEQQVKP